MRKVAIAGIMAVLAAITVACRQKGGEDFSPVPFPMAEVPVMMTEEHEIFEYLAVHYWDDFLENPDGYPCDFALVNGVKKEDVEQAFVNYLSILGRVTFDEAANSISSLFDGIVAPEKEDTSSNVFETVSELVSKYLYDPNSPARSEDLYLPFVSKMAECSLVPADRREVYAREARLCSLNPLGTKAADFVFSDRYGKSYSLYGIRAPYTLLFFSNPGCHACKDIIDVLSGDPGISAAVKAGKLAVLNIYIDSDLTEWYRYMPVYPDDWYNGYDPNLVIRNDMLYNIRAIPSLYLLDEDKRVILKDAPQETVFAWLANNI